MENSGRTPVIAERVDKNKVDYFMFRKVQGQDLLSISFVPSEKRDLKLI